MTFLEGWHSASDDAPRWPFRMTLRDDHCVDDTLRVMTFFEGWPANWMTASRSVIRNGHRTASSTQWSSQSVITTSLCHPERSSHSVIREAVITKCHHNSVVSSSFAGVLLHYENNHLYNSISFCCRWFRATENDVENAFLRANVLFAEWTCCFYWPNCRVW